ncbi:MAG TPA: transposase, partial [Pirellulales bacterium]|nr:transposase [Pirellulales bacterium]
MHEASITYPLLAPTEIEKYLGLMRIVDPETGKSYVEKRRVRFNEAGQPRELTFSCYRRYAFLGRDRTREWFCEALDEARREFAYQLWAYVVMPEHVHVLVYPGDAPEQMSAFLQALKEPVARKAIRYLKDHSRQSGSSRAWWPERRIGNGRALAHYAGLRPA